jgi:hypothetical protein
VFGKFENSREACMTGTEYVKERKKNMKLESYNEQGRNKGW